jgi:uncharacterized PurR-regulated membrane protein YhhQ (DUF165 family)
MCYFHGSRALQFFLCGSFLFRPALSRLRGGLVASYLFVFLAFHNHYGRAFIDQQSGPFRLLKTTRQLGFVVELEYAVMFHALRLDVVFYLACCTCLGN